MNAMIFLGIDLGTSAIKLLAIDPEQKTIATHTVPLTVTHAHSGWSEQTPSDWIDALETGLDALKLEIGSAMSDIKGIGLSGQMHGATLLDKTGKVLRPCILWNDTRSHVEAAALDADPQFRRITGNIVFPGFTAPKLVWLQKHEPEVFGQIAQVLLPKDYLRLYLTGEYASEMSDASGTAWLDTGARQWSEQLLGACDLTINQVPKLIEGTEASGRLKQQHADRWGMQRDVTVAGGAGDNAASAIGLGTVTEGSGFLSLGTSGVLFAATEAFRPAPETAVHSFCHALPDTWHQMGVVLSAASALGWWSNICGVAPAALIADLGTDLNPPGSVTFLPYLAGERTPHNDPGMTASFSGLTTATSRAELTQAVLEGVAFTFRENRDALSAAGTQIDQLIATGGGARSQYWLKLLASVLDIPVWLPTQGDLGAALGAARLGMIASGSASVTQACIAPRIDHAFQADRNLQAPLMQAYETFVGDRKALLRGC